MSQEHPEARLLDLIKKSGAPRKPAARAAGAWHRLRVAAAVRASRVDRMRAVQALLAAAVLASFAVFLKVWTEPVVEREALRGASLEARTPRKDPKPRPLSRYMSRASSRELFGPVVREKTKLELPPGPSVQERAAGLSLIGFLEGEDGIQAILLDRKTGGTSYVRKGETVRDLKVQSVEGGRVVLGVDGETVTLRL